MGELKLITSKDVDIECSICGNIIKEYRLEPSESRFYKEKYNKQEIFLVQCDDCKTHPKAYIGCKGCGLPMPNKIFKHRSAKKNKSMTKEYCGHCEDNTVSFKFIDNRDCEPINISDVNKELEDIEDWSINLLDDIGIPNLEGVYEMTKGQSTSRNELNSLKKTILKITHCTEAIRWDIRNRVAELNDKRVVDYNKCSPEVKKYLDNIKYTEYLISIGENVIK